MVGFRSLTITIHGQIIYLIPQTSGFLTNVQREIHIHTHVNQNLRKIEFFQDNAIWRIKEAGDPFGTKAQALTEEIFKRIFQGLATE